MTSTRIEFTTRFAEESMLYRQGMTDARNEWETAAPSGELGARDPEIAPERTQSAEVYEMTTRE
jgi:hypothetical protein